ncbi:membrane associated rhomboid family serine protease [Actinoplanes campanulatus]|uniref:Membrane associated rhomboid family serine protease n=1 Tax=Actinoplanes campanulatus TaxID=113559 RepID=A0A7W5AK73_9ACTN|nr:rhomboid family intramembrane serine protease [Actinoplanes campanulatus]MBB3097259.1 membrane associated rhomboid family serine protease [Actinoplanes campanulatus]GGN16845.1 rhomboid family intramembrane serine protease [Actinoplanes campanulatus]GID37557.1 rhomboid family intramembrane serine protease [Actinoplanes campanulatus]
MGYGWAAGARTDDAGRFGTEAFYASLGRAFVTMCAVVPALFLIEAIDVALGAGTLDVAGGIIPHTVAGLDGVLFSPFLHGDWEHLYGNAVPLILLGTFVLAGGARRFLWSTALIMLVAGLGVWFVGDPDTVVVGASGVIFGYLGLLLTRGLVERSWWHLAVAAFIGLLYWYQFFNILPTDQRISWQGHGLGLLGGVIAAIIFRRR